MVNSAKTYKTTNVYKRIDKSSISREVIESTDEGYDNQREVSL